MGASLHEKNAWICRWGHASRAHSQQPENLAVLEEARAGRGKLQMRLAHTRARSSAAPHGTAVLAHSRTAYSVRTAVLVASLAVQPKWDKYHFFWYQYHF